MKIVQLITQMQLRGAEIFALQLSDVLASRGHEVVFAALYGDCGVLSTLPQVREVVLGRGGSPGRLPISPVVWRSLCRLIREFRPDIVQANGSETLKYAALSKVGHRSVPIIYRNISVMSMWSGSGFKRRVVGSALRRMDHVASVTTIGKADLTNVFGVREDRVSVIPIGVRVPAEPTREEREQTRQAVRQRFGLPDDCSLVMHVGSFTSEKNHRELLGAFARVVEEAPSSRLLLVGDGLLRAQIETNVRELRLDGRVVLAGVVPDAAEIMVAADVLVLPSLREGLPGVILEAAAAGVPAVAYDVGGVSEVVEDGASGMVVAVGDVESLSSRLSQLLGDEVLRQRLGAEARRRVEQTYTLEKVGDQFEEVYRSVIEP